MIFAQVQMAIFKDMATNYVQLTKGATGVKMDTKQEHKSPGSEQEASNCSEKLASLEQQHEKCIAELEQARAECAQLQTANKQLDEKHNELVARELKVRTMAKKYKLAAEIQLVKQKSVAPAEPLKRPLQLQQTGQFIQVDNLLLLITLNFCNLFQMLIIMVFDLYFIF
jgi:uncharacterized protein (DUF3084 family)